MKFEGIRHDDWVSWFFKTVFKYLIGCSIPPWLLVINMMRGGNLAAVCKDPHEANSKFYLGESVYYYFPSRSCFNPGFTVSQVTAFEFGLGCTGGIIVINLLICFSVFLCCNVLPQQ